MTHAVGVSRAEILSPLSYFDKSYGIKDVVTDVAIARNCLYITTLEGFYKFDLITNQFVKIHDQYLEEFHGISEKNDQMLVGGQLGLFELVGDDLIKVLNRFVHELNFSEDGKLVFTGYGEGGFDVIEKSNGVYTSHNMSGFTEQIKRIIPLAERVALVSHFGNLVFIDPKSDDGRIGPYIVNQHKLGVFDATMSDGSVLAITPEGWFLFDERGIQLSGGALPISGAVTRIQTISDIKNDHLWVSYEDEHRTNYCEKWEFRNGMLTRTSVKFKSGYRINDIHIQEDGTAWFGGDDGVIRFNATMAQNEQNTPIVCHISATVINGDSVVSRYGYKPNSIQLPHDNRSIQFKYYSDQSFTANDEIVFQHKLEGLDQGWSGWSAVSNREYSGLKPGNYIFNVRAKNGYDNISNSDQIEFRIAAPWYWSTYSFIAYAFLIVLITFGYTRWRIRNLKAAKEKLEQMVHGRTIEVENQKKSIEEQREILHQANKTKDQLFSIIGHDLRSPLNSMQGLTDLIRHYRSEQQADKVDELMDHMSDSVKGLRHLLDNLLSWALNQSGNFKIKKEKVLLNGLIIEVLGVLREAATAKQIIIDVGVEEGLAVEADSNTLGTIIRNLVSNAIKFTHEKGKISIHAYRQNEKAVLEITDNGIGISEEKVQEIFQLASSTYGTQNEKGTGLGLVLVDEFVKLNKGTLNVTSKVGTGTTFIVTFPLFK